MDKNELRLHLQKCEKLHERRKLKRFCFTVLFYSAVLMVICYLQDRFVDASLWDILGEAVVCILLSIPAVMFNSVIFHQLTKLNQDEEAALEYLRKRLREKEEND
jgi:RsiW-degrading membrane proteinase PrsW (M82 family)